MRKIMYWIKHVVLVKRRDCHSFCLACPYFEECNKEYAEISYIEEQLQQKKERGEEIVLDEFASALV